MRSFIFIITIVFFSACNNKKNESPILKKEPNTTVKLPVNKEDYEGLYTTRTDAHNIEDCTISLQITKTKDGYTYSLTTDSRNVNGKATFSTNESGEKYVVLEGIKWDEYEGDITNEEDSIRTKELEIPIGIDASFIEDTITIQNYGNAMNYYTKLGECGAKYIQLVKK